jgi:fructose-1,6-bisphosphatase/inositol monophosphatase family enzyme
MIKLEIKKRLLLAINMAKKCEQLLKKSENLKKKSKIKGQSPRDIVLKEDLILENEIYKLISKKFKNDSFLGEESGLKKK